MAGPKASASALTGNYEPATPSDWGTPPTSVAAALDELAGRPAGGGSWSAAAAANFARGHGDAVIDGDGNATCSAGAFTLTNAGNAVDVSGTMFVLGDQSISGVSFQLFRDAVALEVPIISPTGAGDGATVALRTFDEPGAGAHVYSMKAVHLDGTTLLEGHWIFTVSERQLVAV